MEGGREGTGEGRVIKQMSYGKMLKIDKPKGQVGILYTSLVNFL